MDLLAKGIVVPTAGAHTLSLCYTSVHKKAEDVYLHDVHHEGMR